jgi:hypothetical protein
MAPRSLPPRVESHAASWFDGLERRGQRTSGCASTTNHCSIRGLLRGAEPTAEPREHRRPDGVPARDAPGATSATRTATGCAFHPIGFEFDLRDVVMRQAAHPDPQVLTMRSLTARVQWKALLHGALVADFTLDRPTVYANRANVEKEAAGDVPCSGAGAGRAAGGVPADDQRGPHLRRIDHAHGSGSPDAADGHEDRGGRARYPQRALRAR